MISIIDLANYKKKRRCMEMNLKERKKNNVIDKQKMLLIEEEIDNIFKNMSLTPSPSIDIVSLVNKDGFEVETTKMDIETTGRLLVDDKTDNHQRIITVNTIFTNKNKERNIVLKKSRFITAHEYGHFILHNEMLGQPTYAHRDTQHRTEPIEQEADYFARSILMPLENFKEMYLLMKNLGIKNKKEIVKLLSEMFVVTIDKANKRLEDLTVLGLI